MKVLRPAIALVFALGFVSCEKSPKTQKAADDAKKAGEAVKEAAKSGLDAAKAESEAAREATAKKAAELKAEAESRKPTTGQSPIAPAKP